MERLTVREARVSGLPGVCCTHFTGPECQILGGCCTEGCPWEDAVWDRLAAYEDTGLGPEEVQALIPPPNDPLTLEELWEMDGEPVWVVQTDNLLPPFWGLIDAKDETVANSVYSATFEDYGTEWQAYRRRPEEETT